MKGALAITTHLLLLILIVSQMRIDKIVFVFWVSCLLFSCGRKETKERMKTYADAEKEFVESLTRTDSITVVEMSQRCMDSLKARNVEAALEMLYVMKGGMVMKLTGEDAEELRRHFSTFPVMDYRLEHFTFSTQGCNDLKYKIEFAKKDINGNVPAMAFMFNPVKIDGNWYLCIKGQNQFSKDMLHPRAGNSPAPGEVKLLR